MASAPESGTEKKLAKSESYSPGAGQPVGRVKTTSNAKYASSGQKSTDRKTGLDQSDEHYSWRQVYRECGVEVVGHE